MSLIKTLLQLKKKNMTFFTTPTHAQKAPFKTLLGEKYYAHDLSEVDGLDNLNNPSGCIWELENELKKIYLSGYTHMLTNGSTQGMLALMLATLNKRDKVLVATNCHKCVHNGLILTGAEPVWINPNYNAEFGVYTSIHYTGIEEAIAKNPDAKCLILTNPTYDGIITDISKISRLCKEHNIIFIVDEAHGALWNFDKTIGIPAILSGADASVQSLHKTCGAVNPSALVHLSKESKISQTGLMNALSLISTTSPSYPIMVNIEETVLYLNSKKGRKELQNLVSTLIQITNKIKQLENIEIYTQNNDITKIFVRPLRMSAQEAGDILYDKFKIECEIQHKYALTFMCGIGTTKQKLKKLLKGLKYINKISTYNALIAPNEKIPPLRQMKLLPQNAYNENYEEVLPEDASNKICAQIITSYPPGIPILTYGELITDEHLDYLNKQNKIRIVK